MQSFEMNLREGPVTTYTQSNQTNLSPGFLAHNVLETSEKKGEFAYYFSDSEEISESMQQINDQTPANVVIKQTYQSTTTRDGVIQNKETPKEDASSSINKLKQSLANLDNEIVENPKPKKNFLEAEVRSPGSGSWDKAKEKLLQAQLEISQSKLFGLAQRIDACLAISKTDYSNSKVFQPSEASVSKSSVSEIKDEKPLRETVQTFRFENTNEKVLLKRENPEIIGKSAFGSTESSNECVPINNNSREKRNSGFKMYNSIEKGKNEASLSHRQTDEIAIFVSTPSKAERELPPSFGAEFQKQFETVSSVVIETMNDLYKPRESLQFTGRSGEFGTPSPLLINSKEQNLASPPKQNKPGKINTNLKTNSHKDNFFQSPTNGARFSFSHSQPVKVISSRNSVGSAKKEPQNTSSKSQSNKITPKVSPKNEFNKRNGLNAQSSKKTNKYNFEEQNNEEQKDILDLMDQSEYSPMPVPEKLQTKAETTQRPQVSSPKAITKKNDSTSKKSPIKQLSIPHRKNNLEIETSDDNRFEITQTISPVLNDRKSSRGMTPGYQFDAPNISITDTKNLSFDSALFGKELSVKGMDQARESAGTNLKTEIRDEVRSNHSKSRAMSQGKNDRSFYDDELESSFVKAYTTRKNKIINEAESFDERLNSDIYFRRRFKNELQQFLDQYHPKLSGEEAEELYGRLVDDGKKRQVRANKLELERSKSHKLTIKSYPIIQEDQVNKTFDRLVADARKRFFVQEEKEKLKLLKQHEELEEFEKSLNQKKMNREDEDQLVYKMMQDANRRKIKHEKLQRAKLEAEIQEAEELINQRFKLKNNRAKSKVKEYIQSQSEFKSQNQSRVESRTQSRGPIRKEKVEPIPTKSFHSEEKLIDETQTTISPKNDKSTSNTNYSKLNNVRRRYLNIESPSHRVKTGDSTKATKSTRKASPKSEKLSSLEYLKNLRRDIDQYKNNIEENIYTIQSTDSFPLPENLNESNGKTVSIKKLGLSNIQSPKGQKTQIPYKIPNKYKNVESKVAKHIEGKLEKSDTTQDEARVLKSTPSNKTRPKAASAYKVSNTSSTKSMKIVDKDQKLNSSRKLTDADEREKKAKIQAKFMSAQDAINFVERLISDFKSGY